MLAVKIFTGTFSHGTGFDGLENDINAFLRDKPNAEIVAVTQTEMPVDVDSADITAVTYTVMYRR
ncbi:MAG: hypothetical protein M0R06_12275 [Sphaerochaeta sp.]|jgi:hypothetical protein|nr:hypothetical protein [Sphaerochaeta sp.]